MLTQFLSIFSNPALLGGAVAGAIPIVIHLLNRHRYRRVWWAAMHWLWAAMKKAHRRLQIEQIILLIIRTLILILLALALARPALQAGMGLIQGRASVYRVLVLDNSYSMGRLAGGKPLFEKAKELAAQLASELHDGDAVTVLLANAGAEELTHAEGGKRGEAVRDIRAATLSDGGTHLPRAIAAACRMIESGRSRNARKEIIVLTDPTRAAWFSGEQPRKLSPQEEETVRKVFSDVRTKPHVWIVRLDPGTSRENLAVESLEVEEKVAATGVEIQLNAKARNFGTTTAKNVALTLSVDGEVTDRQEIAFVEPLKPAIATFRHTFRDAGSHTLSAALETDALPADNTACLAVDAEKEVKVLCVDGQQRIGANASEMDFFRQALAPLKADEAQAGQTPLQPEVISDGAFSAANLDECRLVVMGNVALVTPERVKSLEAWVRRGGALWVWLGDRVDPAAYNRDLGVLLPAVIGDAVGKGDPEGEFETLSEKEIEHPAIARFRNIKTLELGQLRVYRRFQLALKPFDPAKAQVEGRGAPRSVLHLAGGDVLAAEWRVGDGRVLLLATAADKAWTNWPYKPHYMPLVHFLTLDLIRPAYVMRNRMVGEPFVYLLGREELGPARAAGLSLRDPANERLAMEVSAENFSAASKPCRRAGIYVLEIPTDTRRVVHFAAGRDLEESDLDWVEEDRLRALLPEAEPNAPEPGMLFPRCPVLKEDVDFVGEDFTVLQASLKRQTSGREVWRVLAVAVLVLLLAESLLARRFGNFNR